MNYARAAHPRPITIRCILTLACLVLAVGAGKALGESKPAINGYDDYRAMRQKLERLAVSPHTTLTSLGKTLGRREVLLLTVGTGKVDEKPAILIVGGVHAPHLLGSQLALGVASRLVAMAEDDPAVLDRVTLYVLPRPAPDACEAFFQPPYRERSGNERPTDDDRDGNIDEDGPEDLDGDGWITMMRVADKTGAYIPHPTDPRVLIKADPSKGEQGQYALYVEGRDNDGDEQFGEDGPGGVALNRNFTFRYPYFQENAGPHQVSEIETRALADFAFSRPNIAAVVTFTPEDNLLKPWEASGTSTSGRIQTSVDADDAKLFGHIGRQYQELLQLPEGVNAPDSSDGAGSFSEWAYFHYGRWSFGCRGWSIAVEPLPEGEDKKEPAEEDRGADDVRALRWFTQNKIDGFVDWKPFTHPDFHSKKVEIGGFKPFVRINPPEERLGTLVDKHTRAIRQLGHWLPRIAIEDVEVDKLGGGLWRASLTVVNHGLLPTMSRMGEKTQQLHPLQLQVTLPEGTELITGSSRTRLPVISGSGGKAEYSCLLRCANPVDTTLNVKVWSPSVGAAIQVIRLGK